MSDADRSKKMGVVLGKRSTPPLSGSGGFDGGGTPLNEPTTPEAPFPFSRVYRWIPDGAQHSQAPDAMLVVTQEVLLAVDQHVAESLDREIGGFLLGTRYRCPDSRVLYVVIDQYSRAQFTEATSVSLSFTPDAWARLSDELGGKFHGKELVGWYHSHPRMDVFLSSHDVAIHDQRFSDAWKAALVIEPEKSLGGFFCRRGGVLDARVPVEFYEHLPAGPGPHESVMSWQHYTCIDSRTGTPIVPPRGTRQAGGMRTGVVELGHAAESVQLSPFPAPRMYRWNPVDPGEREADIALIVSQEVLRRTNDSVRARLDIETGGFLLGNRYRCPNSGREYVIVDQCSPAPLAEGSEVSLTFTGDVWARLQEELGGKFRGKELVGWYHSHPSMGIFLSPWDVELQKERFGERWMCALVIDPNANTAGFFASHSGQLNPREPVSFYEYRDRTDEPTPTTSMAWTGYTAMDPVTGEALAPSAAALASTAARPASVTGPPAIREPRPDIPPPATPWYLDRTMQLRLGAAAVVLVLLVTVPSMLRTAPPAGDPVTTGGNGSPNPTVVTTQPPVAPPVVTPPVAPPTAPTIQVTGTYAIAGRQPGQMFQVIVTGAPANPRFTIGGEEAVPARVATGPGRYELQWRATNGTLAKTTLETLQIRGGRQRVEIAMFESGRREPLAKVSEELTREAVVAPPPPPKPPAPSAPSQPAPQAAKPPAGAAAAVPVPQTPPTRVPDDDPRGNGLPPAQGNQSGPDLVRPEPPPAASPRPTESSRQADPPPPQSQNRPERSVAEIAKEVADRINGVCDDDKCKNKRPAEFNAILRAVENLQDVMKERQMYSADLENKRANVANSAVKDTQDRLRKLLGALREIAKGKYTPYQNEFSRREQQKR